MTSWEEKTIDKGILCTTAIQGLNPALKPSEAVLIDNKRANLDAWSQLGGKTYLFTTEAQFLDDLNTTPNALKLR